MRPALLRGTRGHCYYWERFAWFLQGSLPLTVSQPDRYWLIAPSFLASPINYRYSRMGGTADSKMKGKVPFWGVHCGRLDTIDFLKLSLGINAFLTNFVDDHAKAAKVLLPFVNLFWLVPTITFQIYKATRCQCCVEFHFILQPGSFIVGNLSGPLGGIFFFLLYLHVILLVFLIVLCFPSQKSSPVDNSIQLELHSFGCTNFLLSQCPQYKARVARKKKPTSNRKKPSSGPAPLNCTCL